MAEIFGAAVGGVALCATLVDIGLAIHKATKRIKNTRQDVAELTNETMIFAGLCDEFFRTCVDDQEAMRGAASSILALKAWIEKTSTELLALLQKVEAVGPAARFRHSLQDTLIAYLEWLSSKDTVKRLRNSLTVARASIDGFSNLMCIRKLNEELRVLYAILANETDRRKAELELGMKLEEKIQMVQQRIEIKGSVYHTNERMLKAAKEELTLKQQGSHTLDVDDTLLDLFDFTKSLGAYSRKAMPPVRSKRHRSSKHASTSASRSSLNTPPEKKRRDHSRHRTPSHQTSKTNNMRPNPSQSYVTPSSTSSGTRSGNRSHAATASDPISSTSSISPPTSGPRPSQTQVHSSNPITSGFIEHRDTKSREYINAPNGTILSPPKVKSRTVNIPPQRTQRIGGHTIVLDTTHIYIDAHALRFELYETAHQFFEVLLQNEDKLDALVEALAMENEDETWDGIPGWVVDAHGVTMQASSVLGIEDEGEDEGEDED